MVSLKTPSYVLYDARRIIDRHTWNYRASRFYSKLIHEGDVAFDIGANHGNRSGIFLRLGAHVVAVEPQSSCCLDLSRQFQKNHRFALHQAALGAAPGKAKIHIADSDTISSMSEEYIATVKAGPFSANHWDAEEEVDMTTLDRLIAQHGLPAFTKIDVEGFESQVLLGLSQPLPVLSFEFQSFYVDNAVRCVDLLDRLGEYNYCVSLNETLRYESSVLNSTGPEIQDWLLAQRDSGGDVYAFLKVAP